MSDMNELFYADPYARAFDATVVACERTKNGFEVALTDTAFYPEGGGQPADHGRLGDAVVSHVHRRDGRIWHVTDRALEVGTVVHGELDWARRYDNMQNHTGEHILTGVIHRAFGYENVGFHMHDDAITIDMSGELTEDDVLAMEAAANAVIERDTPVNASFPSKEERDAMGFRSKKELTGKIRIVHIPEVDCCACCGTHVKSAREVGILKVLSAMRHRGGTRIEFVCGERARRDYAAKCEQTRLVSQRLSVKPHEIAEAVERQVRLQREAEEKAARVSRRYFALKAETLPAADGVCVLFEEELTPFELKLFVGHLVESGKAPAYAVLSPVTGTDDQPVYQYVMAWADPALRDVTRQLNTQLNGRGGGKDIVQGTFKADRVTVEAAIRTAFAQALA